MTKAKGTTDEKQKEHASFSEKRAILRERARILAQEPLQVVHAEDNLELLAFRLSSEVYAVESQYVREVYPLKDFTHLPGTPPFVLGIINMRGQIFSIVDLKKFFDLPKKGLGQLNKLIILHDEKMEFAILADDILGIQSIPLSAIQPAPPTVSGIGAQYLRGITDERIIILDTGKILGDGNIIVHQEVD
jgi:purine-binding chemotaxis protein CheW